MKRIVEVADSTLVWRSKGPFSRQYELLAGDEPVARMRSDGVRWRRIQGETAEGPWSLQREGVLARGIVVLDGRERVVARFHRGWFSSTVELERGPELRWRMLRLLPTERGFTDGEGRVLLRYRSLVWSLRNTARMTIERDGRTHPGLPALALLGCLLTLLARGH